MTRAIDVCTCTHHRGEHSSSPIRTLDHPTEFFPCLHKDCTCMGFFPNPQPERENFTPPFSLPKLKFLRPTKLQDAAQMLVINQPEWPSQVRCSLLDYDDAGYRLHLAPYGVPFIIHPPIVGFFAELHLQQSEVSSKYHKFILRPDPEVEVGEVWL